MYQPVYCAEIETQVFFIYFFLPFLFFSFFLFSVQESSTVSSSHLEFVLKLGIKDFRACNGGMENQNIENEHVDQNTRTSHRKLFHKLSRLMGTF